MDGYLWIVRYPRELLKKGQEDGEFREFDAHVMAVSIRAAIDRASSQFRAEPNLDPVSYARELAGIFERATREPETREPEQGERMNSMVTEEKTEFVAKKVAPLAKWPVFAIAGVVGIVLLLVSGRYGYFGDELYFLSAGKEHLSWGYADQPWLVPLLARAMDALFPGSVAGLRLPSVAMAVLGVIVSALIARELGGGRKAQVLAAGAYATSSFMVGQAHLLSTNTTDTFLWTVISWLVVRWVRTRQDGRADDKLLLFAGFVTAAALQVKFLIPALWVALGVAALAVGPRDLLRRPLLWVGGVIAILVTVPTLIWQAQNGWPYIEMGRAVAEETAYVGGRLTFVPLAFLMAGVVVGMLLAVYGLWRLLRSPELRTYRFLGWAAIGVFAIFLVAGGRSYYVAGLFPLLWATGAVEFERLHPARWWTWALAPAYLLSAAITVSGLPIAPVSSHADQPYNVINFQLDEIGWPAFTDSVAEAYREIPSASRDGAVIATDMYWWAAAIDRYGPARDLPDPYSVSRGYSYFGLPPETANTVLYVGSSRDELLRHLDEVRKVGVTDNEVDVNNSSQGVPIFLCEGPREKWSTLWPEMRRMSGA